MKILLIDNYDSFTFNLVHVFESLDCEVVVKRQDLYQQSEAENVDKIVLSPGPGLPRDFLGMLNCIKDFKGSLPILGVCLGMQALVQSEEGQLINLPHVKHGIAEKVFKTTDSLLLKDLPRCFDAGLYHSWGCQLNANGSLKQIAENESGLTMAVENLEMKLFGVQFHPESILTPHGKQILMNFIKQ